MTAQGKRNKKNRARSLSDRTTHEQIKKNCDGQRMELKSLLPSKTEMEATCSETHSQLGRILQEKYFRTVLKRTLLLLLENTVGCTARPSNRGK
jgi:hypothetical protein